ncbi:UNVERIFIED_ORG: outer membrane biosynthesis protein TonB [Arthrobacter sp. UYEF2]
MIRSSSVLRDVSAAAAAAVLALLVGLSAAAPAQADDGGNGRMPCVVLCGPADDPTPPSPGKPTSTPSPPAPVMDPPAPPPAPVVPAPEPIPTLVPEPSVSLAEESTSATPSTTIASPSSSASPSTESNWNKPITKSAKSTQAAAVSRKDGSGLFGGPGLPAIMAGVLLVGVSGLAFALWSRNRLASH